MQYVAVRVLTSAFPVFLLIEIRRYFNPNRSLDFCSASYWFRADCNVCVESIADYGETQTVARCRNKVREGWKRKTNSLIIRLFRYYCCPVIFFSYGFREAGPLCETTASRLAAQLWVGKDTRDGSPKGDLYYWLSAGCVSPASRNSIFSCSFRLCFKQGFFALQTRLLYNARKSCLQCKEALF